MQPFLVPDDFRVFMKAVVATLDSSPGILDADDAFQDPTGYGGRIDGHDTYRFTYLPRDGRHTWTITLREAAIRDIADGLLIEVDGERHVVARVPHREPSGEPLLVWGEYGDDALTVHSEQELLSALDGLHATAIAQPRMLRLWSATDDQVVAVVRGDACALYVVESPGGYGTSTGDRSRNESFAVDDHEGRQLVVPFADCVSWEIARRALVHFLQHSDIGDEVKLEGRIPSSLLMMGEIDRKAVLAARADTPREVQRSSIPRMLTPIPTAVIIEDERTEPVEVEAPLGVQEVSAWARRLLDLLHSRELIELGAANVDEISYQLGGLLQAHGTEAQDSLDTAEWLANEIGSVRGVTKLFATGGDLQVALRRSRTT